MLVGLLPLLLSAADPEVARVVASIATDTGEMRATAVKTYAAGCRGKNRFAFRKNTEALEALRPVFRDESSSVRLAALDLTPCFEKDTFEGEVLYLLGDKDEAVKERAWEEAAHLATPEVMITVSAHVEQCAARKVQLEAAEEKWCVFALYALSECGNAQKDAVLRKRVADLAAPLATARSPRIREHVLRGLEIAGNAEHVAALEEMSRMSGLKDSELKKIDKVRRKIAGRKAKK